MATAERGFMFWRSLSYGVTGDGGNAREQVTALQTSYR